MPRRVLNMWHIATGSSPAEHTAVAAGTFADKAATVGTTSEAHAQLALISFHSSFDSIHPECVYT